MQFDLSKYCVYGICCFADESCWFTILTYSWSEKSCTPTINVPRIEKIWRSMTLRSDIVIHLPLWSFSRRITLWINWFSKNNLMYVRVGWTTGEVSDMTIFHPEVIDDSANDNELGTHWFQKTRRNVCANNLGICGDELMSKQNWTANENFACGLIIRAGYGYASQVICPVIDYGDTHNVPLSFFIEILMWFFLHLSLWGSKNDCPLWVGKLSSFPPSPGASFRKVQFLSAFGLSRFFFWLLVDFDWLWPNQLWPALVADRVWPKPTLASVSVLVVWPSLAKTDFGQR